MGQMLYIKLVGHEPIRVFENKEKTRSNQPDFKVDGVAVWVHKTKNREEEVVEEKIQL